LSIIFHHNFSFANSPEELDTLFCETFWLYFDDVKCRNNFKIYFNNNENIIYYSDNPVMLKLNKISDGWIGSKTYIFQIANSKTTLKVSEKDIFNDNGYVHFYWGKYNPVLSSLNDACLTNVDPMIKKTLIQEQLESKERELKLANDRKAEELKAIEINE